MASPGVRESLAALSARDYWMEPDIWEDKIEPNRDRVLDYLDEAGRLRTEPRAVDDSDVPQLGLFEGESDDA